MLRPRDLYLSVAHSIPHRWPYVHVVRSRSCSLHALPERLRIRGAAETAGGSDIGIGSATAIDASDACGGEVDTSRGAQPLLGGRYSDSDVCEA